VVAVVYEDHCLLLHPSNHYSCSENLNSHTDVYMITTVILEFGLWACEKCSFTLRK
jgi:hypothetical protein